MEIIIKSFYPPEHKRFGQIQLSPRLKQIVLGSLLGDGSLKIAKGYKNARFCEKHSIVQEAYFNWKVEELKPELKGSVVLSKPDIKSYSKKSKLLYQSAVHEELTILHHLTHEKNQKLIKRTWLNNIDTLALAVWWCDDGSLNFVTNQGVFCTDGFSHSELVILVNYLAVDWKLDCKIIEAPIKLANGQIDMKYRLRFATILFFESFLLTIMPLIPVPSMLYKVMLCYRDPKQQQRWISEVKKALPNFASEINHIYERPFERYATLVEQNPTINFGHVFFKAPKFLSLAAAAGLDLSDYPVDEGAIQIDAETSENDIVQ